MLFLLFFIVFKNEFLFNISLDISMIITRLEKLKKIKIKNKNKTFV
jgi:hypothetical protein